MFDRSGYWALLGFLGLALAYFAVYVLMEQCRDEEARASESREEAVAVHQDNHELLLLLDERYRERWARVRAGLPEPEEAEE